MAVVVRRSLLAFFVVAGVLALAGALELAGRPAPSPGDPSVRPGGETGPVDLRSVRPGEEREIGAQETHEYVVDLIRGETVGLLVEQRGADVALVHVDPLGRERLRMDRPLGGQGSERLTIVAETAGRHRVKVEADSAGSYRWTRAEGPRPARATDYLSADGEREFMQARKIEKLAPREGITAWSRAEEGYRKARELFGRAHDRHGVAIAGYRMALTVEKQVRPEEAAALLAQATVELTAAGEPEWVAEALNRRGGLARAKGDREEASRLYRQGLERAEAVNFSTARRDAHSGLAWLGIARADFKDALDHLAAAERGPLPLEPGELLSIQLLRSDLYERAGEPESALAWAEAAAASAATAEDRARVVQRRGRSLHELGRDLEAIASYDAVAPELHGPEWAEHRAVLHFDRGRALIGLGRPQEAVRDLEAASEIWRTLGDAGQAAIADLHLAWSLELTGEIERSLALHRRSVAELRRVGDLDSESAALHGLARAELAAGDLSAARRDIQRSVELLESSRAAFPGPTWKSSFAASKSERRALLIEVLMRWHERSPAAGHLVEALYTAERVRERSLSERLFQQRNGMGVAVDAPPELLARRKEIAERLQELEVAASASEKVTPDPLAEWGLLQLLEQDEAVESEIRAADPRYAALTRPQIPALDAVTRDLLDDETCLLFYSLGSERSWLWVIDRDGLHPFALAPRAAIEQAVREAVRVLGRWDGADVEERRRVLTALTDLVLAPAVSVLDRRRLAVVADGALHFAPFAAMPVPSGLPGAGQPLVVDHETVFVPSLSVLAELRRSMGQNEPNRRALALVADPVSSPDDDRLPAGGPKDVAEGTGLGLPGDPEPSSLGRLRHARAEADALLRFFPPDEVFQARDFAATLDLVLSGGLAQARFVHFTGHGFFNEVLPAQSGLVLSRFDAEGRPIAGILRVRDVYRLDLRCEMVVVSACESGRGRIVGGEGVVGLTRGFLAAGARRVVVTLWEVDDSASAHLVGALYRGLLRDGLAPAAALAAAQAEVRSLPGWEDPFFWAGFALVGDWR